MSLLNKIGTCIAAGYMAIASYACESEPATSYGENPCTMQGEVEFEEGFEGDSLDMGKWEEPCGKDYYKLNNGSLEFTVEKGGCGLTSHSTYEINDRPLIFETRWKVREKEGTYVSVDLLRWNENEGLNDGIGFGIDSRNEGIPYR